MTRVWKDEDFQSLQDEVKGFAYQFKVLLAEVDVVVNWISQRFGEKLIDRETTAYKSIYNLEEIAAISAQLSAPKVDSFATDADAVSTIDEQEVIMPGLSTLHHDDSSQDPLAETDAEVDVCNEEFSVKTESCTNAIFKPEKSKHQLHQKKLRVKPKIVKKTVNANKKVKSSRHDSSVKKPKRQVATCTKTSAPAPAKTKEICLQLTRLEHDHSVAASIRSLQNSRNETVIKTATKTKVTKEPNQPRQPVITDETAEPSSNPEEDDVAVPKRGRPKKRPEERIRTYDPRIPMQCDECGKVLKGTGALRVHKQIHQNIRPFNCTKCSRAFRRKHHLEFHMMIHDGTKNEKCRFCGKAFLIYRDLARHERTHTGEKPFGCHLCPKSFNVKQHLTLHIRTHTGERPYKCQECNKTFTQANSLRIHKKIHLRQKDKPVAGGSGNVDIIPG